MERNVETIEGGWLNHAEGVVTEGGWLNHAEGLI